MLCRGLGTGLFFCRLDSFIRGGQDNQMPAQFDESLGLVEVLLILLRQLRGERCKILLAQTDHQKAARKDIVCLAVFIPQSAVHGQTQQLALIVADDGDRVCKGIDSGDRAADSLLQILQLCANGDFLRVCS